MLFLASRFCNFRSAGNLTFLVCLIFFRNLKQEQEHAHEVHCSRERSRVARQIVEDVIATYFFLSLYPAFLSLYVKRSFSFPNVLCTWCLACVVFDAICETRKVSDVKSM